MHEVIRAMVDIATEPQKEYLSSYKQIIDIEEIYDLRKTLVHSLYNNLAVLYNNSKLASDRFDFDFCNPNSIDRYYEADTYLLKERTEDGGYKTFATLDDREAVFKSVMDRAIEMVGQTSEYKFSEYLWGVHIAALKGDKTTTSSGFLFHFSAEFNTAQGPVFLIDTKWFYLKEQFITDMTTNALHILKTYRAKPNILKYSWDKSMVLKENDYNRLYEGEPHYIVCDTLIVDGVELCDVLYYDRKNIYLAHVKAGFNSKVRELTNQILISARRLKEALNSRNSMFLNRFYEKLNNAGQNKAQLSLSEFKALFKKDITYILAVGSTLTQDLLIEEHIEKYDSNIARFSLIQCTNEMYASYYPLVVHQIRRDVEEGDLV